MTPLVALTPNDLATNGAAWLAAIVGLLLGILSAATVILPKLAALKTQVDTLFNLHRDNSNALTILARNTPPPTLTDVAALEANTTATEANTAATQASETPPSPVPVPDGPKATDEI